MKSTMPAATPPRSMPARSVPKITAIEERLLPRARADLLLLAGVLHAVDLADGLLDDLAVLHHRLGQVLVHHDVAGDGIDRDGPARARELPALEGVQGLVGVDLGLEGLDHV